MPIATLTFNSNYDNNDFLH